MRWNFWTYAGQRAGPSGLVDDCFAQTWNLSKKLSLGSSCITYLRFLHNTNAIRDFPIITGPSNMLTLLTDSVLMFLHILTCWIIRKLLFPLLKWTWLGFSFSWKKADYLLGLLHDHSLTCSRTTIDTKKWFIKVNYIYADTVTVLQLIKKEKDSIASSVTNRVFIQGCKQEKCMKGINLWRFNRLNSPYSCFFFPDFRKPQA